MICLTGSNLGSVYMSYQDNNLKLSEYGEFLLQKQLVPPKRAKFYVNWVRRFFNEASNSPAIGEDRIAIH